MLRISSILLSSVMFLVFIASPALAASSVWFQCPSRISSGLQYVINGSTRAASCNLIAYSGTSNGITKVRDLSGPICVYFSGSLAGCRGKGSWADISNRPGQQAVVKTQTTAT